MFDISKPEFITRSIRIPKDIVDELEIVAKEKDISINKLIVECCKYGLENIARERTPDEDDSVTNN